MRIALLIASVIRSGDGIVIWADTASYLAPGHNLLLHGQFAVDGIPDLLRTPGYPLFLALTSLPGTLAASLFNLALSVLLVLLVWKLARNVWHDDRIALTAAWIAAFEPTALASSIVLMSETLFAVLFVFALERLVRFLETRRIGALAAAGLALTAATFVRPATYYLPIALATGLFVVLARIPGMRVKAPAVLLLTTLPWLAAWQLRNRIETGYQGFSSVTDMNFYYYDEAYILGQLEHRDYFDVQTDLGYTMSTAEQSYLDPFYVEKHPEQAVWGQTKRLAFMHDAGVRSIRAHKKVYLRLCLQNILKVIFDPGAGQFDHLLSIRNRSNDGGIENEGPVRTAVELIKNYPSSAMEKVAFELYLLALYFFAARSLICPGEIQRETMWLLLGIVVYFLGVSVLGGGAGADARYRLPIMPIVCLLAAAGVVRRRLAVD